MILSLYKGNIGRDKKDKKVSLQLNVYQKNARAISFYQREGFIIQCEGLDEATGEKRVHYAMETKIEIDI